MKLWFILLLLPSTLMAESIAPYPISIRIRDIISAVGPSWNTAGSYKAVLLREDEHAALYIFRGPYDQAPLVYAPQLATTGTYWGTVPWLEFDDAGTLLLHSENRAHGRNKWEAMLSINEQNGSFFVSAFNVSGYDSLDPDSFTDCAIDMTAQTLIVNGHEVTPFPLPTEVEVENWNSGYAGLCDTLAE